jgi:hypothetical protein
MRYYATMSFAERLDELKEGKKSADAAETHDLHRHTRQTPSSHRAGST